MQEPAQIQENQTSFQASGENAVAAACLNCAAPLLGDFCYRCGQKSDVKPFTLITLFAQLYESFRKFDSEVRNTFLGLLIRPGRFCRLYIDGKRKPFNNPVKYFFIAFVFQVTLFGLVRHLAQHPEIDEAATVDTEFQLVSLAMTFFWAIAYTVVFRREKSNLAENIVCMLYLNAQTRFYSVVIQLSMLPLSTVLANEDDIQSMLGLAISFVYFVFFSRQFFNQSLWRATLKNLLVLLIFAIFAVPIFFFSFLIIEYFKELFG